MSKEAVLWSARLLDSLPGSETALLSDAVLRGTGLTLFNAERYHGPGRTKRIYYRVELQESTPERERN